MGKSVFESLANELTRTLDSYKNTIPGMLRLSFSGLRTERDKITLQLKSEKFMDSFASVDEIEHLNSGDYYVAVKIGELAIVSVLDQSEIQKYLSADISASNRPGPVLCRDQELARRAPVA